MQRYRLTKTNSVPESRAATAETIEEYREKIFSKYSVSPPVDYYVEGSPITVPKVGESFVMARDNRNGVRVDGIMTTSTVASIEDFEDFLVFTTRNSVYKLEFAQ
jgi:hypothetical protein